MLSSSTRPLGSTITHSGILYRSPLEPKTASQGCPVGHVQPAASSIACASGRSPFCRHSITARRLRHVLALPVTWVSQKAALSLSSLALVHREDAEFTSGTWRLRGSELGSAQRWDGSIGLRGAFGRSLVCRWLCEGPACDWEACEPRGEANEAGCCGESSVMCLEDEFGPCVREPEIGG